MDKCWKNDHIVELLGFEPQTSCTPFRQWSSAGLGPYHATAGNGLRERANLNASHSLVPVSTRYGPSGRTGRRTAVNDFKSPNPLCCVNCQVVLTSVSLAALFAANADAQRFFRAR